jgi:hypothetical protein
MDRSQSTAPAAARNKSVKKSWGDRSGIEKKKQKTSHVQGRGINECRALLFDLSKKASGTLCAVFEQDQQDVLNSP